MKQDKAHTAIETTEGRHMTAVDAARPKSDEELRRLGRAFVLQHRKAYEKLAE